MTETSLISLLRAGVERSTDLIAKITEYHGGKITTEYMLTSDIARELVEKGHEVEVEYLNRKFSNALSGSSELLGSKRTDVAVLSSKPLLESSQVLRG